MDKYNGVLLTPDVNFAQVRDGRRSPLFYFDVDLSTARSVAAGTHLILPISGDSFFVDKNPDLVGAATVHFQDTTFGRAPAPVYCEPGFIAAVPFTQVLIENAAQAGKIFRIHYGVGIDFTPGASSSVSINGNVSIIDIVGTETQHFYRRVSPAAATVVTQILAPAANLNGAFIRGYTLWTETNASTTEIAIFAAPAAPAGLASGANRYAIGYVAVSGSANQILTNHGLSRRIPAGYGLYVVEVASVFTGIAATVLEYDLA